MKNKPWYLLIIGVTSLWCIAIFDYRALHAIHHATEELDSENERLRAEVKRHGDGIAASEAEGARPRNISAKSAMKGTGQDVNRRIPSGRPDLAVLLEAHPELKELHRKAFKSNLGLMYLPFYSSAGLRADEIEAFQNLLTEQEDERMDFQSAAVKQGLSLSDPTVVKAKQELETKFKTAETVLLGETKYQQLEQFNRLSPMTPIVAATANFVALSGNPIVAGQGDQLVALLANASANYQSGGTADAASVNWPEALAQVQAQQILTPGQVAALKANAQLYQLFALAKKYSLESVRNK